MNVGDVLERSAHVERVNLVMYAGASGDFNPIHWNETFAKADDGGAELDLRAEVVSVEDGVASVSMTARSAGVDVVKDAVATLRVA